MRRSVAILAAFAILLSLPSMALGVDESAASTTPTAYVSVERVIEADESGVARPDGVAYDAQTGQLLVTEVAAPAIAEVVTISGDPAGTVSSAPVDAAEASGEATAASLDLSVLGVEPTAVAVDPTTGNTYGYAPATTTLWEVDPAGTPLTQRNLAGAGLNDVTGLTVAPSADSTDAPTEQAVYIADAGTTTGSGASITELALVEPAIDQQAVVAAVSSVTLVNTINTGAGSSWNPDSPDPSGLEYIPTGAPVGATRADRLVASDGEVEEVDIGTGAGWHNVNVWFAPRNGGTQTSTMNVTTTQPSNKEPIGVAYDQARNELYICRDNGRVWVHNASSGTVVRVFETSTAPYNNQDAEGLAFHNGMLFMVDAVDNDLVRVQPGPNGVVGTGGDDVVHNYDLQQYGQTEPEGLDADPSTGTIWVVSNASPAQPMIEVIPTSNTQLQLVSSVSIGSANPNSPAGVALAPPSGGGGGFNIYVADRGVDNNDNPNENDGKIYEFSPGTPPPTQPTAEFTWAPGNGQFEIDFTDTSTGNPAPHQWAWNFGDPNTTTDVSSAQNPSYTYPSAGTYAVTLIATNTQGSDSVSHDVVVSDTPPPPSNLLVNGSFELADGSNRPTSWTTNAGFTRAAPPPPTQDGVFNGRHMLSTNKGYTVYQQVNVTAGEQYSFSGWVNMPATSDSFKFQIKIQWRGNSNTNVVLKKWTNDNNGVWEELTANLTAPAGATSARIQMIPASLNGTIYVDDFVFGPAP